MDPITDLLPRKIVPVVSTRGIEQIPEDEVDYKVPHGINQFTAASNTLPMPQSMKGARFTISAKYATQALPMTVPEAPLVDTLDEESGEGMNMVIGKRLGMVFSPHDGVVTNVYPGGIDFKTKEGKKTVELHDYFPGARKTHTTDKALVKIGDSVIKGQPVAHSNYITPDGTLALGKNLRVAFMAGPHGGTFEDSIALSQSAANKLTSSHLYGYDADTSDGTILSKDKFISIFPNKYTKAQLEKFGPDGLPKKGSVMETGDPILLGVSKRSMSSRDASLGNVAKLLRNSWVDQSQVWKKSTPGTVSDSLMNRGGAVVNVATDTPLKVGDKLCLSPDHEVLLDRGWTPIAEVVPGDRAYSMDPVTRIISLEKVTETHAYPHKGEMYSLETPHVSILGTMDHKMPVRFSEGEGFTSHPFRSLVGKSYQMMRIGVNEDPDGPDFIDIEGAIHPFRISTETYLFSVGAYVSKGNLRNIPKKEDLGIETCQGKCILTGAVWLKHFEARYGSGAANNTIDPIFGMGFSARQLEHLWQGMTWGDGSIQDDGSGMNYHSTSTNLRDGFQRLCFLTGRGTEFTSRAPCRGCVTNGRQGTGIKTRYTVRVYDNDRGMWSTDRADCGCSNQEYVERVVSYSGHVYCPTIPPYHTMFIRRNGKTCLSEQSARQGAKGVAGSIIPDHLMPRGEDGEPIDIFINTAALIGRVNPAMVFEAMLGKVARKTGKRVVVPQFTAESSRDLAERLLSENGLSATETITNPVTGRKIPGILTGHQYFMKLEHISSDKISGRAEGGVDVNDQPSRNDQSADSSKRLGGLMNTALVSAGATEVLRDAKVYRGSGNQDMWRRIRAGMPLPAPQVPFIYGKYLNSLRAAGINVKEKSDSVSISAMTDGEVDKLNPIEVNDSSTINPDTGEPIKGGLFDYSMFGGTEQRGWGVIKLDDPVPSPLMEESVRSILGLTENGMREIISGKGRINGLTGPRALKSALENVDLKSMEKDLIDKVRNGTRSGRDQAIKTLSAVRGLVKAGMEPADMMISKIPVIPPAYRPATVMDGTMLVSDSNYLYKDLLEARNGHRSNSQELPEEELGDERLAIYDAVKAIQGFGDPIHPEHRAKNVKGFVRQITGTGGPKTGLLGAKVLGHPVNTTGRSVIIPDGRLDMDHVGIPEKMAWKMYAPFVIGRMVKDGMKSQIAATETENHSKTAKRYLLDEMGERPMLYSRDPALHRFAIMGGHPVLVPGDAIRISPLVVMPFTADFDGNCVIGGTKIILAMSRSMAQSLGVMKNTSTNVFFRRGKEVLICLPIEETPYLKDTVRLDKNGAEVFDVPDGIEVVTTDTSGKGVRFSPVTTFTRELGCSLRKITTSSGKEVTVSSNESLAVLSEAIDLERITPDTSVGRYVAVTAGLPRGSRGTAGDDSESGWFLGMLCSDGWVSHFPNGQLYLGMSKAKASTRERAMAFLKKTFPEDSECFGQYREIHDADINGGIGGESVKFHWTPKSRGGREFLAELREEIYHPDKNTDESGKRSALFKRLPASFITAGYDMLIGILDGFFAGDGTLCISHPIKDGVKLAKGSKKPQILAAYSTSSKWLRDDFRKLCSLVGINTSFSTVRPVLGRVQRHDNYVITISTPTLADHADRLTCDGPALDLLKSSDLREDSDRVPLHWSHVKSLRESLKKAGDIKGANSLSTAASRRNSAEWFTTSRQALSRRLTAILDNSPNELAAKLSLVCGDRTTRWEEIVSVEEVETAPVYDLCVPETKVFAIENGLVIYDSMNTHLPISKEAVKEVYEKMMPSQNLLSIRDRKVHYKPSQEFILGLYNVTAHKGGEPVNFATQAEARAAYDRGEIAIDTPVRIGGDASSMLR